MLPGAMRCENNNNINSITAVKTIATTINNNVNNKETTNLLATTQQMSFRTNELQFAQFVRGLRAVLHQWTALLLVAEHCDANAIQNLEEELLEWHRRDGEIYSDEMELFFEDFFDFARAVSIEDDSMKEVADVLHDMYRRCSTDDFSTVEEYIRSELIYRRVNPISQCVNLTPSTLSSSANFVHADSELANMSEEALVSNHNCINYCNEGQSRANAECMNEEDEEILQRRETHDKCADSNINTKISNGNLHELEELYEEEEQQQQQQQVKTLQQGLIANKQDKLVANTNRISSNKSNTRKRKNAYMKSNDGWNIII